MTAGVVIFAYANELIDYVAMASWSAGNIHRHLSVPVCLITDQQHIPAHCVFDQVIHTNTADGDSRHYEDFDTAGTWRNHNRLDVCRLSPWDRTLVLDADYVVASDQLHHLLQVNQDFLAHNHAHDVTGLEKFLDNNFMGQNRMPMSWATVMMYRRSTRADLIFDTMRMIQDNWNHYSDLMHFDASVYRNDYALTLAQSVVNGHVQDWPAIPWSLPTVSSGFALSQQSNDIYRVDFVNSSQKPSYILLQQDFHAMGKRQLGAIVANPC